MLFRYRTFIARLWRQMQILQQCQLLRSRGFRVRRCGSLLLIAGGQRCAQRKQRPMTATPKSRAPDRSASSTPKTSVSSGVPRNSRPYR